MLNELFSELLATFIEHENIKKHYKNRLVGTVLNGYLSLRKLVVQRTKLIDETQDKLLELLEEMTTGKLMKRLLLFARHIYISIFGPKEYCSSQLLWNNLPQHEHMLLRVCRFVNSEFLVF